MLLWPLKTYLHTNLLDFDLQFIFKQSVRIHHNYIHTLTCRRKQFLIYNIPG